MQVKKIVKSIAIQLIMIVVLLYAMQYVVDNGLRKSRMQQYAVWNDIYSSGIKADVLISGGSRAWMHISPKILDTTLHVNSYNLGIDGWYFPMQYARLKVCLEHNPKPKYIIQGVDLVTFTDRKDLFVSEQFLPYLGDTIIRNITSHYVGKFTTPEYIFPMFKYNNQAHLIKEGIFCYFNIGHRATNNLYKGYSGVDMPWNNVFDKLKASNPHGIERDIDSSVVLQFESYLKYCQSNNIKVILVFQPLLREEYEMEKTADVTLALLKHYVEKYNLAYLDYTRDSLSYDRKYFIDYQHLNAKGSELFSLKFAQDLKTIIN